MGNLDCSKCLVAQLGRAVLEWMKQNPQCLERIDVMQALEGDSPKLQLYQIMLQWLASTSKLSGRVQKEAVK